MRLSTIAAALCAMLIAPAIRAETFVAVLSGSGFHQSATPDESVTWTGQVTVVTDGVADGTYSGDTLESITVDTNVFDWSFTKGQTQIIWEPLSGLFLPVGPEPGASVTLADGRLASVNLVYDDYNNIDWMSGLQVQAQTVCRIVDCHGTPNNYVVSGALTPVPEAPNALLLLAGLGLAGSLARRHRA